MYLANRAPELFPGARFAVAHCNFQLRGAESDGDGEFVRSWCSAHGMECFCRRFDTVGYASEKNVSIEMAARELRYAWFGELCRDNGFEGVAVAHNANDNAETLMLNLLRGTGSRGMRGMSGRSVMQDLVVLRPMLGITREEIRSWMESRGFKWREDSTNAASEYKRNRIRNEVFPIFKGINPSFIQTLNADMTRLAAADDIAEDYFEECRGKVLTGDGHISVTALLAQRHWEYLLWRLVEHCGFSQATFDKLTALLERYRTEPSGTVTLSGKTFEAPGYILRASRRMLIIDRRP